MAMAHRDEAVSLDDLLPPEIWHQILTKLPVKSILQCRSVCKAWYSLISSPHFITDHASQTLNPSTTNRVLVQRLDPIKDLQKFSSQDESFVESHEHDDLPKQLRSGTVRIVGSCNGLVCLLKIKHTVSEIDELEANELETDDIVSHSFLIWNPSIRKSVQLPFRPSSPANHTSYLLGFGFDSDSGDYKVLRVGYFIKDGLKSLAPIVSEVFDLRKGVWRAISPPITPCYVADPESCVYLHGRLHWMGFEDNVLVSFNLSSDVSLEMGMPGGSEFKDDKEFDLYSVLVNNGLLSVALLRHLQGVVRQVCCTVWSMKEYGVTESWTKLFSIELPYALTHLGLLRFWENGEVVIAGRKGDNVLVVYNPQDKTCKALLSVSADEVDKFIFDVCLYKESLFLL